MKQDEAEWVEYQNIMHDVVKRSGLNKSAFYDLRGNHDNFAVPVIGGPFDFFSKYSLHGQLKRSGKVSSITVEVGDFHNNYFNLFCTFCEDTAYQHNMGYECGKYWLKVIVRTHQLQI